MAIIAALQALGVAVIGGLFAYYTKRAETQAKRLSDEQRARDQMREDLQACMYDLVFANTDALEVLLHQAHGDHVNGNVDDALASIKNAKSECNRLVNRTVTKL